MRPIVTKPTFAKLEGKLLSSVSARVKVSTIQKCADVMNKHFVTGHRQLWCSAFPFHQLEKHRQRNNITKNKKKGNSGQSQFYNGRASCTLVL